MTAAIVAHEWFSNASYVICAVIWFEIIGPVVVFNFSVAEVTVKDHVNSSFNNVVESLSYNVALTPMLGEGFSRWWVQRTDGLLNRNISTARTSTSLCISAASAFSSKKLFFACHLTLLTKVTCEKISALWFRTHKFLSSWASCTLTY